MLKNQIQQRRGKTKYANRTILRTYFLILIVMLTSISLISSASYDNIKSFDSKVGDYGKITIRDWFGLRKLVELTLTENSDICNVDCSAEKEIILHQSAPLIDDVRFLIKQRNGDWEEGEIENYYFQIVNDKSTISYEPGTIMPAGTYTLRLIGKKDILETVDWQITSQGKLIDDWAQWTSGLNKGLIHYWNFNENTGTNINDKYGTQDGTITDVNNFNWDTGILGSSINSSNSSNSGNITFGTDTYTGKALNGSAPFSVSIWVYLNEITPYASFFTRGFNSQDIGKGSISIGTGALNTTRLMLAMEDTSGGRFDLWTDDSLIYPDRWIHVIVTYDGDANNVASTKFYVNGTAYSVSSADNIAFDKSKSILTTTEMLIGDSWNTPLYKMKGKIDEFGMWNRTLNVTEVSELYNSGAGIEYSSLLSSTLNSPVDNYESVNRTVTFNCSATDLTEVSNITLWINGVENYTQTGSATTFLELYQTLTTENGEDQNWTCKATNPNNDMTWATNKTFNIVDVAARGENHEATAYETSLQNFSLDIQTKDNIKSLSGKLWYDAVSYDADITSYPSNIYNMTKSLELPLADTTTQNKSFNWEIILTLTDDSITRVNSSTFGQDVQQTLLILCNATWNATMINFTSKSAKNPYPNVNATFKSSWKWYINGSSGSAIRNTSYEELSEGNNSWGFCLFPQHENFIVSSVIEYDGNDLAKNYYFLNDALINNQTQNISIYLLNDSLATLTVLKVQDEAQNSLEDVYIQIQPYDVGTDTYYTTAMAKTASNGEDLSYLNWYDTLYKFVLTQNGEVILITSPYKISETPQIFVVSTGVPFPYDKFRGFIYSLTFNNVTNNFILTYTKPSGLVEQGCLRVIKRTVANETSICNICETSSSATLYCNINGYGNGTYLATFYATGSYWIVDTISHLVNTKLQIYDILGKVDGTVYAFFFSGIVMAMFFVSPVLAIIGVLLGVLGAIALGFLPMNYIEFIGVVILGGGVIWLLKK